MVIDQSRSASTFTAHGTPWHSSKRYVIYRSTHVDSSFSFTSYPAVYAHVRYVQQP